MKIQIRPYQTEDTQAILDIINHNILHSTALYDYNIRTFEQQKNILEEKNQQKLSRDCCRTRRASCGFRDVRRISLSGKPTNSPWSIRFMSMNAFTAKALGNCCSKN